MSKSGTSKIPAPKGTRDLFPEDFLRQRYITDAWRRVSIRHGFEEIAGPTFEMLDLYKKKSGEGIVSELFSFRRAGGDDDYALRPEFTPTLARMYAEKANALPSPCKWFTAGPYFRAEKPQRGRLREFLQWNCDVMGSGHPTEPLNIHWDAELMSVLLGAVTDLGLGTEIVKLHVGHRGIVERLLKKAGVSTERMTEALALLDRRGKVDASKFNDAARAIGLDVDAFDQFTQDWRSHLDLPKEMSYSDHAELMDMQLYADYQGANDVFLDHAIDPQSWNLDTSIARGLAYYTGTVFELIADGERAVAGGGRYDNLIELFGGPPTPAVGFGMGDVVLGLLLEDKGLMPEGPALMDALSQKPASLRPEAFVVAGEDHQDRIEPLLAQLRRGTESEAWKDSPGKPWDADRYETPPMHARRSYKSTKNIGKLLADARKQHAKFAVIIESDEAAKVENLGTREDLGTHAFADVGRVIAPHL